jgi:serine/threonine protein kinase
MTSNPFTNSKFNPSNLSMPTPGTILLRPLITSKNPLHLCTFSSSGQVFVIKQYPFKNHRPSYHFLNEVRFANLDHPNVIKIFLHREREEKLFEEISSYTLMECAPFGDLHTFLRIRCSDVELEETLVRTYFRQLIEGLEFLHFQGISHLDLKPKNLLIGKDFQLKITDFDLSYKVGDKKIQSKGTFSFRAPELLFENCTDPNKADIFSAGIILFVLRSGGRSPQQENIVFEGHNLYELMHTDNQKFWSIHEKALEKTPGFFSEEFKSLFNQMMVLTPQDRLSIEEIKQSKWYNGPVYDENSLIKAMEEQFGGVN